MFVTSEKARAVHPGQTVTFQTDSLPGRTFQSTIRAVGGQLDPASGSVPVTAIVANPGHVLKDDLYVKAQIVVERRVGALYVPKSAVLEAPGADASVVTLSPDGTSHVQTVKTGLRAGDRVEILSGLSAGQRVVTQGGYGLPDGTKVTVAAGGEAGKVTVAADGEAGRSRSPRTARRPSETHTLPLGAPQGVLTLTLLLCALGGYFALNLPVAIFPQLVVPRVSVSADAGDIPLETTLAQVTRPLEAAVSTVPGVTNVASVTSRGSDSIDVTFAWGTDMQLALQRVQGQIAGERSSLPVGANVAAEVINPSIFPIMGYSLTSKTLDLVELRRIATYTIRPRLARLPGVAQIRITGGDTPEFLVAVEPRALAAHGLTLQDVQDAIAKANGVSSVGQLDHAYQRYEILVSGLLRNEDDVRSVTVAAKNGVPIAVSDIAVVSKSIQPRTILATGNGSPAVIVNVIKQPDANTAQVADEVHATLADLKSSLPAGVATSLFYDQSEIVRSSENSVIESIVIGGVLALIVLTLFLGDLRAASIVLIILPLTILITFGFMKALGQTLNIMTLGALAIALGLVIDDGIVVVENIFHERERGRSRRAAIAAGIQAITPAMVGSSLTTMAAFLPLTFLSGVTGQFFGPLALVMVATLFVSLMLALCLTPLLADVLLPRDPENIPEGGERKASLPGADHGAGRRPLQPHPHLVPAQAGGDPDRACPDRPRRMAAVRQAGDGLLPGIRRRRVRGRLSHAAGDVARRDGPGGAGSRDDPGQDPRSRGVVATDRRAVRIGPRARRAEPGAIFWCG